MKVPRQKIYKIKCSECKREWTLLDLIGMDIRFFEMIEKGECPFCGGKLEEVLV